jgi:hypothetical protein
MSPTARGALELLPPTQSIGTRGGPDLVASETKQTVITLHGRDGSSHQCEVLDVFNYEGHDYALLLKLGERAPAGEGGLVVMRLLQQREQSIFQTISSDQEFERVAAHVVERARQTPP